MAPQDLLRVTDLSVAYDGHQVVSGVDLALDRGGSLALIGESGSGKSSVARAVLRLLPSPDEKTVSTVQLVLALRLEVAQIPLLETTLASLRARHLAERLGVDGWRRTL